MSVAVKTLAAWLCDIWVSLSFSFSLSSWFLALYPGFPELILKSIELNL
jgi:hypothetical protein